MSATFVCRLCNVEKPLSDFTLRKGTSSPHSSRCKQCCAEVERRRQREKRVEINAVRRSRYASEEDRREAAREWQREYLAKNREKVNARRRELHAANPEKRLKRRDGILQWKYGITQSDYEAMFASQGGKCAICRRGPEVNGKDKNFLFVDHDHETGAVRELLCHPCNSAIGQFGDDTNRLIAAIAYLRKHGRS